MAWSWQNIAVVLVTVAFIAYLLWRMRPALRPRAVGRVVRGVAEARTMARNAKTARERAEVLCHAGDLFAAERGGSTAAVGHYLRAMRADPTWVEPIDKLRKLLWKSSPRTLEKTLWHRLAAIPWEGETRAAAAQCLKILAELHRSRLPDHTRAQVFSRAYEMFTHDQGAKR